MTFTIPEEEIATFLSQLQAASMAHSSTSEIERLYRSHCHCIIPDRAADAISNSLIEALQAKVTMSVIRIGDGEANLLTYRHYPGTPQLDRYCAEAIIAAQEDRFIPSDEWLIKIRQAFHDAVIDADIIGVRGVERWSKLAMSSQETLDVLREKFLAQIRGTQGLMRSEYHMLKMANLGLLHGKVITSAHLYFGILKNIRRLLAAAPRIVLISSRMELPSILSGIVPQTPISLIPVGRARSRSQAQPSSSAPLPDRPDFLDETSHHILRLGSEMRGALCMIGAGPWSELYCRQAKEAGAVAVDVGSGLDLLCGAKIRPVHHKVREYLPNWPAIE